MIPRVNIIPNLTKSDAEDRAIDFKDSGWTTEIIQESDGTFTLKATPPGGTFATNGGTHPPPKGDGSVGPAGPTGPSGGTTTQHQGNDILAKARPHIGEKYIFGTAVAYRNPGWKGPWDCAEFATWCVFQTYGFLFGCDAKGTAGSAFTGQWKVDAQTRGQLISVMDAMRTPGAFLLRYPATGAKTIGHIVISNGDGSTIEAADHIRGVIASTAIGRRWDTGVHLPGVNYGAVTEMAPEVLRSMEFPNPDPKVKEIQLALTNLGFDPGPADGLFSEQTETAVAAFQVKKGLVVDGEVGPDTAAALFGAPAALVGGQAGTEEVQQTGTINRDFFFSQVKNRLFSGSLQHKQIDGLNAILDEWGAHYAGGDDRWLAYALATTHHETGQKFQPVEEIGKGRGKPYGVIDQETGKTYYGRGFVQLTWKANYASLGKKLNLDLVSQPELALELDAASKILFIGMTLGLFTGKKLADYFNASTEDWVNARRIINILDKATLIAGYGQQFYAAIKHT